MRSTVKLLHTSDLHLDCDGPQGALGLAAISRLPKLLDSHGCDALLIAGDLFDSPAVSRQTIERAADALRQIDRPVVILSGNHDRHGPLSALRRCRHALADGAVQVIDSSEGAMVALDELELDVWGRASTVHDPSFRPLAGAPTRGDRWLVVMGHGHVVACGERRKPAALQPSAPISGSELVASQADYVALGHWHRCANVSVGQTVAWYSGSPVREGNGGTVLIVTLRPGTKAQVDVIDSSTGDSVYAAGAIARLTSAE